MRVWPARHATVPHSVRSPQVFMSKLAGLPVTWSSIARPSLAFSIVVLLSRGGDVVGAAPCVVAVAVFLACLIWVDLLFAGFADGHGSSPEMSSGMMAGTRPGAAVAMVLPSRMPVPGWEGSGTAATAMYLMIPWGGVAMMAAMPARVASTSSGSAWIARPGPLMLSPSQHCAG